MKKQFHITLNNKEEIIVDLNSNESVTVRIYNPPTKLGTEENALSTIEIDGLRWNKDKHFHLGWLKEKINIGDKICLKLLESTQLASPLVNEEEYVPPEKECSFCYKKKSEVEVLVEKTHLTRICNECVELAQKAINEYRNAD